MRMKNNLYEIIDFEKINILLEGFYRSTGFVTAILDLEGNILSRSGWRQICTEFHRVNPKTASNCMISDTQLANKMALGEKIHFYKCLNGIIDIAIPIVINDEHIANLFTGQIFFEKPDIGFFKKQAEKYGFNEKIYLGALENVPVISIEKVKTTMDFLLKMTELIVEISNQKFEQVKLGIALSESEEKYRLLHAAAGVGIGYYSVDGVVISFNNITAQYLNGKPEDFTGKSIFELFSKPVAEFIFERIEKAANSDKPLEYEDEIKLSLEVKWFNSIYNRIIDSSNKITGIQIISTDITDRKLAEVQKAEIYKRFERISDNVPGAIFEFRLLPDGSFLIPYASSGMKKLYEISPQELNTDASKIFNLVHPDDRDNFFNSIYQSAEKLTNWHNEHRVLLSSGKTIWLEGTSTPQKLEDGSILWYGYITNITERKQAETELFESKSFFEQLFIQSSTSTQLLDRDGWCVRINPKLSELFGVLPEHIEGRKYNIFHDDEIIKTGVINNIKRVFENLESAKWEVNFDIKHASESTGVQVSKPERRWFHNISYPILNAKGELIYVIIQHEDITEQKVAEAEVKNLNKKLEKKVEVRTQELSRSQVALLNLVEDLNEKSGQLQLSKEKLEAKNKELETFTYSVSHDLKAPLRGIDGYSRLLEEMYSEKLEGEGLKFIKTIREGTKQMNQLIEDLLAYSRLERSIFRTSSVNIKELTESIVKVLNNGISGNIATININVDDCKIDTDYNGLSIVLRNLLENAIKFTGKVPSPQINIHLKENVNSWLLIVEDNGIGFDMKFHDRIFEIFQRLNLPEQYAGTGIGLAMVNKSVERMNSKIWAESSPGNGAKFYLEIPKNQK